MCNNRLSPCNETTKLPMSAFRVESTAVAVLLLVTFCSSCQSSKTRPIVVEAGMTHNEVTDRFGEPNRRIEFLMPDGPFLGPSEDLSGLVIPGTPVEEWVFVVGNTETFVWFVKADSTSESRSIDSATYPEGATF